MSTEQLPAAETAQQDDHPPRRVVLSFAHTLRRVRRAKQKAQRLATMQARPGQIAPTSIVTTMLLGEVSRG